MKKKQFKIVSGFIEIWKSKLLLTMKLTVIALCLTVFQGFALITHGQSAKINLKIENISIKQALSLIEDQTNFFFLYNGKLVNVERKVNVDVNNQNINDALKVIFSGTDINYEIVNRQILLSRKEGASEFGIEQQKIVSGKITDSTGGGLPGVSVIVKGTTKGVITDMVGNYSISNIPENAILQFSFVGMKTQDVAVAGKSSINIVMREDAIGLDEVVAVGYGIQKKATLTGSIATIGNEKFQDKGVVTNPLSALQGSIAGVSITKNSGAPGRESFALEIRGAASLNGSEPLIVVDGIPMASSDGLRTINPDDIETMSVLKDASSAIYGARAASGVVLITMKRGKSNQPIVTTYKTNVQFKNPGLTMRFMNMQQWAETYEAAFKNDGTPLTTVWPDEVLAAFKDPSKRPASGWMRNPNTSSSIYDFTFFDTDWFDVLYGTAVSQSHNINISGSTKNSAFMISAGYVNDGSTLKWGDDWNKKYNLRLNYDVSLSNRIKLSTGVSLERNSSVKPSAGFNYPLPQPGLPPSNIDGKPYSWEWWRTPNTLAEYGGDRKTLTNRINANTKLSVDITDGLQFIGQAGLNYWANDIKSWTNKIENFSYDGTHSYGFNPSQNSTSRYFDSNDYLNLTGYFDYKKVISNSHTIGFMAGGSQEKNTLSAFSARRNDLINDNLYTLNLASATSATNDEKLSQWAISSFFGRANYAYEGKYLLEVNGRYDGSSKFKGDNRWKFFTGVSGGWRISEEAFLKNKSIFDDLKLRASWGQAGNQNGIGLYDYAQLLSVSSWQNLGSSNPVFGTPSPVAAQSTSLSGMISSTRTWETVETTNTGIDFAFLNSRLTGSFDYFIRKNKNMLIGVNYSALLGSTPPYTNNGELKTNGWELSLGWKGKINDFQYFVKGNLSNSHNKLVKLGGQNPITLGTVQAREGYAINTHFGWEWDGFIQTDQELADYKAKISSATDLAMSNLRLGDSRFKDLSGPNGVPDGKLDQYDAVNLGDAGLHYLFSLSAGGAWKGFDFAIDFQGVGKHLINRGGAFRAPMQGWWNGQNVAFYNKTWTPDNRNAELPRLSNLNNEYNYKISDWYLEDGSYIRLKNIVIGYTLPQAIVNKVKLSKVRVYFSGNDIWEFQHIKTGWDPEASTDPITWDSDNTSDLAYPFNRTYSFGLDITF